MKLSQLPFSTLRRLLHDLGFEEWVTPKSHIRFEHTPTNTVFLFRPYDRDDRISMIDLLSTRKHLDERGLLSAESFDAQLLRASA